MANGDTATQETVKVRGPDGKRYVFPSGTTKDKAVSYFKTKGIGATPAPTPDASKPTKEPVAPKAAEQSKDSTYFQQQDKNIEHIQASIQRWRPRWDDPKTLLQDPHWYGSSAKYMGGEAIGAAKAGAGVLSGGLKILNDALASVDPVELYKRPTGEPASVFTKDIVDTGKGILNVGKAAYDLVRHFPESSADPEAFGNTVMNIAMTVDGGLKGAKAISEHLGFTPADAISTAKQMSKGAVDGLLRQKAVEDAFVHKNGVGIAKDITSAVSEASKEVKVHTTNLSKIDTQIPSGVIDASKEADVIKNAFADVVKTPDPMNRALNDMVQDAKNTAPGQWTFEKARQFRSKLGRALSHIEGPQNAVASRVYGDLTQKLKSTAKQYGLEDSWKQYNELEKKIHKSFGVIDAAQSIIDENGEGAKMASALKDKAAVKEVIDSLSKYGLDGKKVVSYSKRASKLISERGGTYKSIFKQVYGMPGAVVGLPVLAGIRAAGVGYPASIGAGALAGIGTTYLIHALRAARLSPEILDGILTERQWPGRLDPPEGKFPSKEGPASSEGTQPKAPPPTPKLPAAPTTSKGPSAKVAELPKAESPKMIPESISNKAKAAQVAEETKTESKPSEPKVTKLPPEAGSRATKQRERVAKVRKEKGSTALGGGTQEISGGGVAEDIAKTHERINTPHLDVSNLQIPEMEEALQKLSPSDWKELQRMRKKGELPDTEYQEGLRAYLLYAYEDKIRASEE